MIIPVSKNLRTSSAGAARGVFIERMTDGFVAVDADWYFSYLNPKAYELLQAVRQSQEELVGQNMWLAFPELVGSAVESHYRRAPRVGAR